VEPTDSAELGDFSLVKGGPVYRLMVSARLITGGSYARMAIAFCAVAWLPLLLLSIWQGTATGTHVRIPFLHDAAAQARLLIALPVLVLGDTFADAKFRTAIKQFVRSDLIVPEQLPRFLSALRGTSKLLNSSPAEAVILVIVVIQAFVALSRHGWIDTTSSDWYSVRGSQERLFTAAGWWFHVSLAILNFFLGRWLWRLLVWTRCLWQINKLDLRLVPNHPDLSGGLGFVSKAQTVFGIVIFAFSAAAAGTIANRMIFEGETLRSQEGIIYVLLLLLVAVFACPLLLFTPRLYQVKKRGQIEFGALSMDYVQSFDAKWLRSNASPEETLLGSVDIQSLADLSTSFNVMQRMRIFLIDRKVLLNLFACAAGPFLPLLLIVFPLAELVKHAWKLVF
jgi:hypothetical protein